MNITNSSRQIRLMGKTYKSVEQADFKRRNRTLKSALRTLALVGVRVHYLITLNLIFFTSGIRDYIPPSTGDIMYLVGSGTS